MNSSSPRSKLILGIVIFAIVCVVMVVFALFQSNNSKSEEPKTASYTDPYSGETIVDTEGKVDETYNNENSVVYFGFAKLLEYGMTRNQVEILQTYILQYSLKRAAIGQSKLDEVTIDYKTFLQSIDENTGEKTVTFDVIANRDEKQRYFVVNKSPSISTMWTDIYAASDKETPLFNAESESFHDNN